MREGTKDAAVRRMGSGEERRIGEPGTRIRLEWNFLRFRER
jgi:hypothetical protein